MRSSQRGEPGPASPRLSPVPAPAPHHRLFAEMRRRHVFIAIAAYGAIAFIVLRVADLLASALPVQSWFMPFVVVVASVFYPVALALAWHYERTPSGLVRTDGLTAAEVREIVALPATRRLPASILALAGLAVFGLGVWTALDRPEPVTRGDTGTPPAAPAAELGVGPGVGPSGGAGPDRAGPAGGPPSTR